MFSVNCVFMDPKTKVEVRAEMYHFYKIKSLTLLKS